MRLTLPGNARAPVGALVLALLAAACSASSGGGAPAAGGQVLQVKVKDFAIKAREQLTAGPVVLRVRNDGPDTHELILARADGRELPLRKDNLTIDEDALKPRTISLLEDALPGTVRAWKLHLAPGRYVLFCNMSGHYLGGMHLRLVVR